MNGTTALIIVAVIAWLLQICLGFFQIQSFNRVLQRMSQLGNIKIGKTKHRYKPKTIIIIVENAQGVIIESQLFKGISVFARAKSFSILKGHTYPFSEDLVAHLSKDEMEALSVAYEQ